MIKDKKVLKELPLGSKVLYAGEYLLTKIEVNDTKTAWAMTERNKSNPGKYKTSIKDLTSVGFDIVKSGDLPIDKDISYDVAVDLIQNHNNYYDDLPLDLKNDKEFALDAMKLDIRFNTLEIYAKLPQSLQVDPEITNVVLDNPYFAWPIINKELSDDKELAIKAIEKSQSVNPLVESFSDNLKDDIDVINAAIAKNPKAIDFASERIKENPELLKPALDDIIKDAKERTSNYKKEAPSQTKDIER